MKLLCCGVFLSLVLCAVGCKRAGTGNAPADDAFIDYNALRMEVVKAVKSGELKPDANGAVTLPDKWAETSQGGQVFVTISADYGQLVAFRTMAGNGFGKGILYADKALGKDASGVQVGSFNLVVQGKSGDHWYRVGG